MEDMDIMSKGVKGLWDEDEHARITALSNKRRQEAAMLAGNCKACEHSRKKREGNSDVPKIDKAKGYYFCFHPAGVCAANEAFAIKK